MPIRRAASEMLKSQSRSVDWIVSHSWVRRLVRRAVTSTDGSPASRAKAASISDVVAGLAR